MRAFSSQFYIYQYYEKRQWYDMKEHFLRPFKMLSLLFLFTFNCVLLTWSYSKHNYSEYPPGHVIFHKVEETLLRMEKGDDENNGSKDINMPCWGYESFCSGENAYLTPNCNLSSLKMRREAAVFWDEADFGLVKKTRDGMSTVCRPSEGVDSSLVCSPNIRHCYAKNLYIDFTKKKFGKNLSRDRETTYFEGDIGGFCSLDKSYLKHYGTTQSQALQSWKFLKKRKSQKKLFYQSRLPELESFTSLRFRPVEEREYCDEIFEKSTIFMKIDQTSNMYHHFCDFLNLFISQHVNGSLSNDVVIVVWAKTQKTSIFEDPFFETWSTFSRHPVIGLDYFIGRRVCFRDVLFPFLPRMIKGLYYNMPLVDNCHGSGMFKAFSEHILHRLGLNLKQQTQRSALRITFLRRSTKYRKILNADEMTKALKNTGLFKVKVVDYNEQIPFVDQLKITVKTDIFIGIHGAGLTHLLFLPDWAVVFELYHTEDPKCYRNLARLRGIKYITWEKMDKLFPEDEGHHHSLGAHPKYTNYSFDVEEFIRIVKQAAEHVRRLKPEGNYPGNRWDQTGLKEEL